MKALVTGGAGFIASHLEDKLIDQGWDVVSVDCLKNTDTISHLLNVDSFEHHTMDATNVDELTEVSKGCDFVFHLAANSDIRIGGKDPEVDFKKTFMTTKSVLDTMVNNDIKNLFFSSTSAVYGENQDVDLNEKTGDLQPISYYGGYKLASESIISAYTFMNSLNSLIFRFPNVVGPRLTHGVIFDFVNKLKRNPNELEILGDGKQSKQYVYVTDLVDGIMLFSDKIEPGFNIYNISTDSFVNVDEIADAICSEMDLSNVQYRYTGGTVGWKGDVPSFSYDISKAESKGWTYRYDSKHAVEETVRSVLKK